jgi:hypothetical protein
MTMGDAGCTRAFSFVAVSIFRMRAIIVFCALIPAKAGIQMSLQA